MLNSVLYKRLKDIIKNYSNMFRITKDPSSGSETCTLTEITCNVSQMLIMCVVGVWPHV